MAGRSTEVINVREYSDQEELNKLPKDDQAIVFAANKDTPIRTYVEKLNEYVEEPKSFLYGSRITGNRISIVLSSAELAKKLVEEVGEIKVDGEIVKIKYFIAKSVKVIISNANYGISNSAIKKYLKKNCDIRTASSVAEFEVNMGSENKDVYKMKSFRRYVYIHPDDVNKLPTQPVKFLNGENGSNVFFEVDSPKCFICGKADHFKINCPNSSQLTQNSREILINKSTKENNTRKINDAGVSLENKKEKQIGSSGLQNEIKMNFAQVVKGNENVIVTGEKVNVLNSEGSEMDLDMDFYMEDQVNKDVKINLNNKRLLSSNSSQEEGTVIQKTKNKSKKKSEAEKQDKEGKSQKEIFKKPKLSDLDESFKIAAALESARAHLEATSELHKLDFDKFVEIMARSASVSKEEKRNFIAEYTLKHSEFLELLQSVHGIVKTSGIKRKITNLKKALLYEEAEETESLDSEVSDFE